MNLGPDMLEPLMRVIPLDLTVIDAEDRIVWWNRHEERMFKIPVEVQGKDVRECHPEKSVPVIDRILSDMRRGERDFFRMWFDIKDKGGRRKVVIDYVALRDEGGHYLGCLEIDQDVEELRRLDGEDRSLR